MKDREYQSWWLMTDVKNEEVMTLRGLAATPTKLSRQELERMRLLLIKELDDPALRVCSISGCEIRDQAITLAIDGIRYPISRRVFSEHDVSYVAKRIKEAHFLTKE